MRFTAIVAALVFSGSCAFGAEWIRITKPLPWVGKAVKVGEEYEVRRVLGKGADKMYTIKARGKIVAVKATDVQLLDAEHVQLKIENRALKKEIEALKRKLDPFFGPIVAAPGGDKKDRPQAAEKPKAEPERAADLPKLNAPLNEEQKAVLAYRRKELKKQLKKAHKYRIRNARIYMARALADYGHSNAYLAELKRNPRDLTPNAFLCARQFRKKWKAPEVAAQIYDIVGNLTWKGDHADIPRYLAQACLAQAWDSLAMETGKRDHMQKAVKFYRAAVAERPGFSGGWDRIRALEAELKALKANAGKPEAARPKEREAGKPDDKWSGFRGIKWGQDIKTVKWRMALLKKPGGRSIPRELDVRLYHESRSWLNAWYYRYSTKWHRRYSQYLGTDVKWYAKRGDKATIGTVPVSICYWFYKDRFAGVLVRSQSRHYEALKRAVFLRYGKAKAVLGFALRRPGRESWFWSARHTPGLNCGDCEACLSNCLSPCSFSLKSVSLQKQHEHACEAARKRLDDANEAARNTAAAKAATEKARREAEAAARKAQRDF